MLTFKPAELTTQAKEFIRSSQLTDEALARACGVSVKVLQEGIKGEPSARLVLGLTRATGWEPNEVALFKQAYQRPNNQAA